MKALKSGVANKGREKNAFWFLDNKEDALKDVTSEASNKKLGIVNIAVYEPTEKMAELGVVAKVSLETTSAYIDGITIWNSKNEDGSIYLTMQSRSYEKDGKKQYHDDTRLKRSARAQVLRYIWALTEDSVAEVAENDEDEE